MRLRLAGVIISLAKQDYLACEAGFSYPALQEVEAG